MSEEYAELSGDDWREYFEESTIGLLICSDCAALVAPAPEHAFQHIAWHQGLRSKFDRRPGLY